MKALNTVLAAALMLFSVSAFSAFDINIKEGTISVSPSYDRITVVFLDNRVLKLLTYRKEYAKIEGNRWKDAYYVLEGVTETNLDNLQPNPKN